MRDLVAAWRRQDASVGLVPTMGALHAGHLSLVGASAAENSRTVVSIFVNPLQFGPGEDFARYPRNLGADLAAIEGLGVDAVFAPSLAEMYPAGATTRVRVSGIDEVLEGASRPGHFEGVATVVSKLFWAVRPNRAYFGLKDAQQVAVLSRLAADLGTGIEIRPCPIVREGDGLALSSRNAYLSEAERAAALVLYRSLRRADAAWRDGERDPDRLREEMRSELTAEPLAQIDYAETVDPGDFRSPGRLAVLAVRVGATRLIDNHLLGEAFEIRPAG
ncbi:MAG: pantoate--beta-alanine ligase [Candidatus Dormibacteraceae bacterium]